MRIFIVGRRRVAIPNIERQNPDTGKAETWYMKTWKIELKTDIQNGRHLPEGETADNRQDCRRAI